MLVGGRVTPGISAGCPEKKDTPSDPFRWGGGGATQRPRRVSRVAIRMRGAVDVLLARSMPAGGGGGGDIPSLLNLADLRGAVRCGSQIGSCFHVDPGLIGGAHLQ